jgi:hypothetical protein
MSIDEQFIYNFKKIGGKFFLWICEIKSNSKTFKKDIEWEYRVMLWTKTFQYTYYESLVWKRK